MNAGSSRLQRIPAVRSAGGNPGLMSRSTIFDALFRTRAQRQRFAYWQTVPLRRLSYLLFAVFCLFGMIAVVIDLLSLGRKPVLPVLVWTLFTGVTAVSYVLVLIRKPRYLLIPVAAQLLGSRLIKRLIEHLAGPLLNPPVESGVRIGAIAILVLSMAACAFFLLFIEGEGRHSVRIQTELSLAHSIQQTLVPTVAKRWSHFEVYGVSVPSDKVGGDLVDVVSLRDGSVFAYVADIAGHGLPAGILMGMVKTAVRTQLFDLPGTEAVFKRLNEVLPAVKEPHMYATCAALRIFRNGPPELFQVEYAISGLPALMHASPAKGSVSRLSDEQLPLGLLPGSTYRSHHISVQPDDVLLIATDGILEAEDRKGEAFGMERLERLFLDNLVS
jgi:hypothetical protein